MKLSLTIPSNLDFTEFRQQTVLSNKIREMDYDLCLGDVMVRMKVSTHDFTEQQLVTITINDAFVVNDKVFWSPIFPMMDMRYQYLTVIKEIWGNEARHYTTLISTAANQTITTIERLLKDIARVQKLKAFL
jgi:hypothetical protein